MDTSQPSFEPSYIALYRSGELKRRAGALEARLACCDICPRECGINRLKEERGFCRSGALPAVSTVCAHHGEEPVLSGSRGSGTIFFGNCTMRCVYCQNYQISQDRTGQHSREIDCNALAEHMLHLQKIGCHNINFVSPSHFVPQIVRALLLAVPQGLHLPLVYNTSSYDSMTVLKELDGIVDIYLPDLRYASGDYSREYSQATDYPLHARNAIREMYRQVGNLVLDDDGVAVKGVIVRHLILPNGLAGSRESLEWLANELSPEIAVSIMSQYHPAYNALQFPLLSRTITKSEYREVVNLVKSLGLKNGWLQYMGAEKNYLPDFKDDNPFDKRSGGE